MNFARRIPRQVWERALAIISSLRGLRGQPHSVQKAAGENEHTHTLLSAAFTLSNCTFVSHKNPVKVCWKAVQLREKLLLQTRLKLAAYLSGQSFTVDRPRDIVDVTLAKVV